MEKTSESKLSFRLAKFFIPFILGFSIFGVTGFLMRETIRVAYWPLITGYFFPPFGKESIIPAGVALGIHPVVMALSIAFVDIVVAYFLYGTMTLQKKFQLLENL
jgi:hypothetical protein